jgi:hypothetical protein
MTLAGRRPRLRLPSKCIIPIPQNVIKVSLFGLWRCSVTLTFPPCWQLSGKSTDKLTNRKRASIYLPIKNHNARSVISKAKPYPHKLRLRRQHKVLSLPTQLPCMPSQNRGPKIRCSQSLSPPQRSQTTQGFEP